MVFVKDTYFIYSRLINIELIANGTLAPTRMKIICTSIFSTMHVTAFLHTGTHMMLQHCTCILNNEITSRKYKTSQNVSYLTMLRLKQEDRALPYSTSAGNIQVREPNFPYSNDCKSDMGIYLGVTNKFSM